uniref:Uncharacterized protein n=1 Tax=Anguilla anguilla TaxID=7936 RepID=A0A0E9X2N9_ANGAN
MCTVLSTVLSMQFGGTETLDSYFQSMIEFTYVNELRKKKGNKKNKTNICRLSTFSSILHSTCFILFLVAETAQ